MKDTAEQFSSIIRHHYHAMHELSIVEALIEQVRRELERAGQQGRVLRLELSIGRLSGVNCDSVRFAFGLLAPGTRGRGRRNRDPGAEGRLPLPRLPCPNGNRRPGGPVSPCASSEITIEGGRELMLQSIEIED